MERRISSPVTVAFAGLLFAVILALRAAADSGDATLVLFVLPIALGALELGMRGGP